MFIVQITLADLKFNIMESCLAFCNALIELCGDKLD